MVRISLYTYTQIHRGGMNSTIPPRCPSDAEGLSMRRPRTMGKALEEAFILMCPVSLGLWSFCYFAG